jgi:hypothetical protein
VRCGKPHPSLLTLPTESTYLIYICISPGSLGSLPQVLAPPLAQQWWHQPLAQLRRSPAALPWKPHFNRRCSARPCRLLVCRHVLPPDSSTPRHGAVSIAAVRGARPSSDAPCDALGQTLCLMRAMCLYGARTRSRLERLEGIAYCRETVKSPWSFCRRRRPWTLTTTHRADLFAADSSKSPPSSPSSPPPPPGRKRARGSLERTSVGSKYTGAAPRMDATHPPGYSVAMGAPRRTDCSDPARSERERVDEGGHPLTDYSPAKRTAPS